MEFDIVQINKADEEYFEMLIPQYIHEMMHENNIAFLGAVDEDNQPVGVLAYCINEENAEILYVGVMPFDRRKGIAKCLIASFCQMIDNSGFYLPIQAIWDSESDLDFGRLIRGFSDFSVYVSRNFYEITPGMRTNNKAYKRMTKFHGNTVKVKDLTRHQKTLFMQKMKSKGLDIFINDMESFENNHDSLRFNPESL